MIEQYIFELTGFGLVALSFLAWYIAHQIVDAKPSEFAKERATQKALLEKK